MTPVDSIRIALSMIRPTVARVDLDAVRPTSAPSSISWPAARGVIAVVKANAYGHGAAQVALALEEAGAAMLACADIEEGIVLREAGVTSPILVFGALSVSDLDGVFDHNLTPTISTPSAARALQAAAARGVRLRLPPEDRHGHEPPRLPVTTTSSDAAGALPRAEPPDRRGLYALRDRRRSRQRRVHASSASGSSAVAGDAAGARPASRGPPCGQQRRLLRDERVWFDYVRPGLLLYGIVPPPLAATMPLRPALSLSSRVVAVKGMRPGEGTGYGLKTRPISRRRSPSCRPAMPTVSTSRLAGRGGARSRAGARRSWARCAWT